MKNIFLVLTITLLALVACKPNDNNRHDGLVSHQTVQESPLTKRLYFSGTIKPIDVVLVTAPVDGLVDHINVDYGDDVTAGTPLFVIKSDSFKKDFASAFSTYLKAKDQLLQSQSKLENGEALFKEGLISRNEINTTRSTYYTNNLSFLESEEELDKLAKTQSIPMDLKSLGIEDINEINTILDTHSHAQLISVNSPADGVVLFPDADDAGPLEKNASIKKDDAVFAVGNMRGVAVEVGVSEVDINHIKLGLPAVVTSIAFPGLTLKGTVTKMGNQAKDSRGGSPEFVCVVSVVDLTVEQKKIIHVGMSAKVQILIVEPKSIVVPITAVSQVDGRSVLNVIRDGRPITVDVVTGETNMGSVVILKGLRSGDQLVLTE